MKLTQFTAAIDNRGMKNTPLIRGGRRCPPDKGESPKGEGVCFWGTALLPYREGNPP